MRLKHIVISLLLVAMLIIIYIYARPGCDSKADADVFRSFPPILPPVNVSATPSPTAHTWPSPSIYPTPSTFPLLSAR